MHSRIFQVSTEPIDKADYITESDYYDHWFTYSIADYVDEDTDRAADIEWLNDCARGYIIGHDDNGEYLLINNKEEYFKNAFKRFQELLDKVKGYDINGFINGINEMWGLKNEYEEKYGFYVQTDDNGLITLDEFIRVCEENQKYYIGGTIDYHC